MSIRRRICAHSGRSGFVAAALVAASAPSAAQVFRCDDPPTFQDRPCPNAVVLDVRPSPVVHFVVPESPPQFPASAPPKRTSSRPAAAQRKQRREDAQRKQRCEDAQRGLRALQQQRRRGYTIDEEAGLDRQRDAYEVTVRADC